MKYCQKCGKELFDEAVICPGCGCQVSGAIMPVEKETPENFKPEKLTGSTTLLTVLSVFSIAFVIAGLALFGFIDMTIGIIVSAVGIIAGFVADAYVRPELKKAKKHGLNGKEIYKKFRITKLIRTATICCGVALIIFGCCYALLNGERAKIPYDLKDSLHSSYDSFFEQYNDAHDLYEYSTSKPYRDMKQAQQYLKDSGYYD